jgi:hypothetical protein
VKREDFALKSLTFHGAVTQTAKFAKQFLSEMNYAILPKAGKILQNPISFERLPGLK